MGLKNNPRQNFPEKFRLKNEESEFVASFECFISNKNDGFGFKEFGLAGFGIADLIWVNGEFVTAFEMKLKDWKRALYQAYRYSYFADQAIVVLPTNRISVACKNLELFKDLNIGLWGFNFKEITKFFTPDFHGPKNPAAKTKALNLIRSDWSYSKR